MNPNENTYPAQEPAAAGETVGPTYELGQIVDFTIYGADDDGRPAKPFKTAGSIIGPDLHKPGQMILQEGLDDSDTESGAVAGRRFSVWHAGASFGLVCGVSAPTRENMSESAAAEATKGAGPVEVAPPANVPDRKPMAIIHRGPHTQAVIDILAALFGGATAEKIAEKPVGLPDGTVLYAVTTTPEEAPAIGAQIEQHKDASGCLALVEPTPEQLDLLAEANLERRWPVLTAPEL